MEEIYYRVRHIPTGLFLDYEDDRLHKESEVMPMDWKPSLLDCGELIWARVNGMKEMLTIPRRCFEIVTYKLVKID